MLLKILQYTGQCPKTRNHEGQNVDKAKVEKPCSWSKSQDTNNELKTLRICLSCSRSNGILLFLKKTSHAPTLTICCFEIPAFWIVTSETFSPPSYHFSVTFLMNPDNFISIATVIQNTGNNPFRVSLFIIILTNFFQTKPYAYLLHLLLFFIFSHQKIHKNRGFCMFISMTYPQNQNINWNIIVSSVCGWV